MHPSHPRNTLRYLRGEVAQGEVAGVQVRGVKVPECRCPESWQLTALHAKTRNTTDLAPEPPRELSPETAGLGLAEQTVAIRTGYHRNPWRKI